MTAPALLRVLNEAAMQHVLQLKLSVFDLEPHQISWVLLRLEMNIHRLPNLSEEITIITNPSGFERVFTYRDYRVVDNQGETLVEAATTWVLLNTETRRPCRIPDWIRERAPLASVLPALPRPTSKFSDWSGEGYAYPLTVGWHDLDFNWHLNNSHYLRLLLDSMPIVVLKAYTPKNIQLHYQTEASLGDQLVAQSTEISHNNYQHRLVREAQVLAVAESIWELA
jgi:acyl-ACP thioesterase